MAKSKKSKSGRTFDSAEKKQYSRPTHFLCFPLARESTVPVLAKSMAYFREVSTEPRRLPPVRGIRSVSGTTMDGSSSTQDAAATADHGRGQPSQSEDLVVNQNDPLGNTQKSTAESSPFIGSLKVLPDIVHRGAGTLHLTLGVMDLSKETEMQKATDLLHDLDLKKMLRDASEGPPPGMKSQRRWKDKREETDNIISGHSDNDLPGQKETGVVEDELSVQVEQGSESVSENSSSKQQIPRHSEGEDGGTQNKEGDFDVKSLNRPVSPPALARQPSSTTPTPKPLYLSLTGIKAFPSPKKARVIWAQPRAQLSAPPASELNDQPQRRPVFDTKEGDRLYNFALHLHQAFKDAGLVNETRQPVLHATLANMRYKVQAKGGRETKGKAWKYGKKRWEEGLVDIRPLAEVFNRFDGDVAAARREVESNERPAAEEEDSESEEEGEDAEVNDNTEARDDLDREDPGKEYIWCQDIKVDRIAICKMGATKSEDPMWKEWYPPVVERVIFGEGAGG